MTKGVISGDRSFVLIRYAEVDSGFHGQWSKRTIVKNFTKPHNMEKNERKSPRPYPPPPHPPHLPVMCIRIWRISVGCPCIYLVSTYEDRI